MKTNPNEPAYPRDHVHQGHNGVTKRELFAVTFMSRIISQDYPPSYAAEKALEYVDALIEALNKE